MVTRRKHHRLLQHRPALVTLVTALLAVGAACTQPDEQVLLTLSSLTAPQELVQALELQDERVPQAGP